MAVVMNLRDHAVPLTVGLLASRATRNVDPSLPLEEALLQDGTLTVVDNTAPPAPPIAPTAITSSIVFSQTAAALTESLAWRAPRPVRFVVATVALAAPVDGDTDLFEVLVDGDTAETLVVPDGQRVATANVDVPVITGAMVSVRRLALDGGAAHVQLDRGA